MPSFQKRFADSGGKPITYKDKTLFITDRFPVANSARLRLYFEASNGEWRQGVVLRGDAELEVNGKVIGKHIVLWNDTAPPVIELGVRGNAETLTVYNVWDAGDGTIDARHNGAAMIIEEVPNGRRYRCNDGLADDDFDDIVFRIERV